MSVSFSTNVPAKLLDPPEVLEDKDKPIEIASLPRYVPPPATAPTNNSQQSTSGAKGYTACEGVETREVTAIWDKHNQQSSCPLQAPVQNKPDVSPAGTNSGTQQNRSVQPASGNPAPANTPVKPEPSTPVKPDASVTQTNKLQGRDPDLIFAGDKIKLSNGQIYTAKSTDTLSGIASKTGNSLESLMKQNGFDSQLLGKNASGKYYDLKQEQQRVQQIMLAPPGGSVPQQGGAAVSNTTATNPGTLTANSPNGTERLEAASSALKKLQEGVPGIKTEDLTQLIQLFTKLVANLQDSKNPALSTEEFKNLGVLVQKYNKELSAVQVVDPAATTGSPTPADSEPKPTEPTTQEINDAINPGYGAPTA
jgi:LysM repeat protein